MVRRWVPAVLPSAVVLTTLILAAAATIAAPAQAEDPPSDPPKTTVQTSCGRTTVDGSNPLMVKVCSSNTGRTVGAGSFPPHRELMVKLANGEEPAFDGKPVALVEDLAIWIGDGEVTALTVVWALGRVSGWSIDVAYEDVEMAMAPGLWQGDWTELTRQGVPTADGRTLRVKRRQARKELAFEIR